MKQLISIFLFSISFCFAQNEDMDFQFEPLKAKKETKLKFYLTANLNMVTILSSDATTYREDIEIERQRLNFDIFRIDIYPGAQVGVVPQVEISERVAFLFGLKYQQLGWSEVARRKLNSSNYYRYNLKNHFHYVGLPIGFSFSPSQNFHISIEHNALFLVGNSVTIREVLVLNNEKEKEKRKEDFEDIYQVKSMPYISLLQLGFHVDLTENIRFNLGTGISSKMISNSVNFKFVNTFAGVSLKL